MKLVSSIIRYLPAGFPKRLFRLASPTSIRRQILALSIFNSLALLACVGIGSAVCIHAYNRHLYSATADGLYATSAMISQRLMAVENLSSTLLAADEIQESLNRVSFTDDPAQLNSCNQTILNALLNSYNSFGDTGAAYIAVYNSRFTTCTNWACLRETGAGLLKAAQEAASKAQGKVAWTCTGRNDYLLLSREIRQIQDLSLKSLGTLVIAVDLDKTVRLSTRNVAGMDSNYLITDGDRLPIYASPGLSDSQVDYFLAGTQKPYQQLRFQGHTYFTVLGALPYYDFYYISVAPYDAVASSLSLMGALVAAIALLGFLAVLAFTRRLMKRLGVQLDGLTRQMQLFGDTELSMEVLSHPAPYYDELETIHGQFCQMAEKIHTLVKVNYTNEILTRDAQLKALKTQINPHFLYNTLQTINWRAKAKGDGQTSQIVESLGTLLRASLSNEHSLVRLSGELELVECYITIQRIRFEDRLAFESDIEPGVKEAVLPPLAIQPLVENAIHYGMEAMTDTCHVLLSAGRRGDALIIQVRNEGSSFEEDLLEKLSNRIIQPNGFGIGLLNIDRRIRLMYGEGFGLSVSNEGEYAVAQIRIPFCTEE